MSLNEIKTIYVRQYCPAAKAAVSMHIQGETLGSSVDGKVVDCGFKSCAYYRSNKCWIGVRILASTEDKRFS